MQNKENTEFDYVIVGAGSAGATLAARLSEDAKVNVCLIEAGGKDKNPLIHIPIGLAALSRIKNVGWEYDTVPQPGCNNRELFWPRGKTLGGSSSINAMCYIRGDAKDYDKWASLGAEGWDWKSVLPYFKKAQNQERGSDEFHGVGGPLNVADLRSTSEITEHFLDGAKEVGHKLLDDFNRIDRIGAGYYQVTQKGGQRCSTAKGYLASLLNRPNLEVRTGCLVQKVVIEGQKATGVEVFRDKRSQMITATKEVILSAGAVNTPQILMLSGIGPAEHIAEKGIAVKLDSPYVGQNLQDHLDAIIQWRSKSRGGYALHWKSVPDYIKAGYQYLFYRKGMMSSNIAEAGAFLKTKHANGLSDIQMHFLPAIVHDHGRKLVWGYGYGLHVCCLYPESRGEIKLRSSNPGDKPHIDPRYLTAQKDCDVMLEGVKMAREILASSPFKQYESEELLPGKGVQSDEDIMQFIRNRSESIYHPVGTCKMGSADDETAVVTPDLKFKGIDNLRVVDASVMPTLIGGNTNAPTIMIAEKAAEMMLQG